MPSGQSPARRKNVEMIPASSSAAQTAKLLRGDRLGARQRQMLRQGATDRLAAVQRPDGQQIVRSRASDAGREGGLRMLNSTPQTRLTSGASAASSLLPVAKTGRIDPQIGKAERQPPHPAAAG